MRPEKIIGAAIVLIVVLGFLRCFEGLELPPYDSGSGGAAGDGGTVGEVCGDAVCASGEDLSTCAADCDHDLVVVVEKTLSGTLATSLETYVDDLAVEGALVRIETWEAGTVQELKSLLFDQVDRYGVEGAFLIGNMPAAFYEHRVICLGWDRIGRCVMYEYEEFPLDVYLQDRDASWEDADGNGKLDSHGDLNLEIFVSRLQDLSDPRKCRKSQLYPACPEVYEPSDEFYASEQCLLQCPSRLRTQVWEEYELGDAECCGPYFLRRYFERLHAYRTTGALVNRSALLFADDDFVHMVQPEKLALLYGDPEILTLGSDTTLPRYLDELVQDGHEFVHQLTHSTVRNLYFYDCAEWDDVSDPPACLRWNTALLNRTLISAGPFVPSQDLKVSFANMYNCHASRFTQPNLGMAFTVQTSYGLATVGNTRKGGMTDPSVFHGWLAEGASWGESFRRWYNQVGKLDDRWFLGIVLTGDPLLTIPLEPGSLDTPRSGEADEDLEPTETPRELTEGDPPGTYEDYRRQNPQFFKN